MFSIITPAFLSRFFILFALLEREMNTLATLQLLTYCLDDVITVSPCTPQKFTS